MDDMFESKNKEVFIGKDEVDIAGKEFEVDDEEDKAKFVKAIDMDQSTDTMERTHTHTEKRKGYKEKNFL